VRRQTSALLAGSAASLLAASLLQGAATAAPPPADDRRVRSATERTIRTDMLPNPLADKQAALRDKAIELVLKGRADIQRRAGGSNVVRLGRGQFVEVSREASDTDPDEILTFLSEFGNRHKPGTPQGIRGPRHNQIPRPDRNWNGNFTDDNETIWQPNFSRGYYLDLMFGDNN
jgi:immune inhibitor A